jgi:hypothetical protein
MKYDVKMLSGFNWLRIWCSDGPGFDKNRVTDYFVKYQCNVSTDVSFVAGMRSTDAYPVGRSKGEEA